MNARIFLIAVTAFLGVSQLANAGVMLFVHFGENAPDVIERDKIQTSYTQNGSDKLTASIYLHLTDINTSLYGYRFSVRYNSDLLLFNNREQFRPKISADGTVGFVPDPNVENEYDIVKSIYKSPEPGPVLASDVPSPIANGMDLYRFNGIIQSNDNFVGQGFYKLASVTFAIEPLTVLPPVPLVLPGQFDYQPKLAPYFDDDIRKDLILSTDSSGVPISIDFTVFDGSAPGGSVPEPHSALVFSALGLLVLIGRKARSRIGSVATH